MYICNTIINELYRPIAQFSGRFVVECRKEQGAVLILGEDEDRRNAHQNNFSLVISWKITTHSSYLPASFTRAVSALISSCLLPAVTELLGARMQRFWPLLTTLVSSFVSETLQLLKLEFLE